MQNQNSQSNCGSSHGSDVSDSDAYRRATFRAATTGLRAYTIAIRLRDAKVRPGIDFRGCTKREIESDYIDGMLSHLNGSDLRKAMQGRTA